MLLKFHKYGLTGFLMLFFFGCIHNVNVNPDPKVSIIKKYNLKAGVLIEQSQLDYKYTQDGFCLVGAAHTWNVPVGEALKISSLKAFNQIFTEVTQISSFDETSKNSINIVIKPSIRSFEISQTIHTEFILHAFITDNKYKTIYEREFTGGTKNAGPFFTAFMCGYFRAPVAFSDSVNSAFEDVFEKMYADILKSVDFNTLSAK